MTTPTRKIGKWACDGCKLRKIKCSDVSPCPRCVAAGLPCTFNKRPLTRGPRNLRAKTIRQISTTQLLQQQEDQDGCLEFSGGMSRTDQTPPPGSSDSSPSPDDMRQYASPNPPSNTNTANSLHGETVLNYSSSDEPRRTSTSSLVLRLCVYRLRLFPVWPIVDVEEIMGRLHSEPENMDAYALANAVGAATIAQLKLEGPENGDMQTAALMEAECQRAISLLRKDGQELSINLNALRVSFFLHAYHENRSPGGSRSLLYLREAITIAQIMGLHREVTYSAYTAREQQMRRRILSLLFVTERGVAMLHKLPVMLRYNSLFMDFDDTCDETHVLPAFKKLVTLFWMFDQSGAFDILHTSDEIQFPDYQDMQALNRNCLSLLQRQLREVPIQPRHGTDVQIADICVTRQWMQVILWRASMKRSFTISSSDQQATSLSHPIQLAKEFLDTMSQIPSSAMEAHGPAMEYKIYEIAKAVTDSITTESNAQATALVIPTEILLQLRSKLASCRGGNKILLPRLHAHISDALLPHSLRIYDITENGPSTQELSQDAIVYTDHQAQPQPSKSSSRNPPLRMNNAGHNFGYMIPLEDEEFDPASRDVPWNENDTAVLLPPDHDLFNQGQIFQSSFNNIQTTGAMELLFANSASWNSIETWNIQADATMDGSIMNGMPNTSD